MQHNFLTMESLFMYKNILVPISFDAERNISIPLQLTKLLASQDAKITLLHAIVQIPAYALAYIPKKELVAQRRKLTADIEELSATLKNAEGLVVEGHAGREILDWTEANKPDLIIMASRQPGLFLGSTANYVVRHAPCSVHVVR
jgi:universal stress protein F